MVKSRAAEGFFLADCLADIHSFVIETGFFQDWPASDSLFHESLTHLSKQAWQVTLPLLACQAVGGAANAAIPVSAAWAAMLLAGHRLDSIQDGAFSPEGEIDTQGKSLGVVVMQLFAISRFIASIQPPDVQAKVALLFSEAGSDSTVGQHLGLSHDYMKMATVDALEAYWRSVILKSGSLFRVAAAAGAAIGTDSHPLIETLGNYGTCIGVMLQVLDDCRDILNKPGLEMYEISLPLLLYALATSSDQVVIPQVRSPVELNQMLEEARVPGALSAILMEWRQRALRSLVPLKPSQAKTELEQIVDGILKPAPSPSE